MKHTTYNFDKYIFQIKNGYLWVIDNPTTDLSSMDFFDISKIDGIYNYKTKSNETDFAIALIVNGSFYYRTIDKTPDNIKKYLKFVKKIEKIKTKIKNENRHTK